MSKLDAQRAMKLAKYERDQARAQARTGAAPRPAAAPVAPPAPRASAPVAASDTCGHRSMNGRTCTREAGHSEKNHRYS